jgi:hypothetical protein
MKKPISLLAVVLQVVASVGIQQSKASTTDGRGDGISRTIPDRVARVRQCLAENRAAATIGDDRIKPFQWVNWNNWGNWPNWGNWNNWNNWLNWVKW